MYFYIKKMILNRKEFNEFAGTNMFGGNYNICIMFELSNVGIGGIFTPAVSNFIGQMYNILNEAGETYSVSTMSNPNTNTYVTIKTYLDALTTDNAQNIEDRLLGLNITAYEKRNHEVMICLED